MAMSPVPIFLLLVVVRLREFVVLSVVLGKETVPGLILVVIPAVVVLCLGNLWGTLLGTTTDHQRRRRCKNRCKKNGTKVALRAVHYEFLILSVSRKKASGAIPGIAYTPRENARRDVNMTEPREGSDRTFCLPTVRLERSRGNRNFSVGMTMSPVPV